MHCWQSWGAQCGLGTVGVEAPNLSRILRGAAAECGPVLRPLPRVRGANTAVVTGRAQRRTAVDRHRGLRSHATEQNRRPRGVGTWSSLGRFLAFANATTGLRLDDCRDRERRSGVVAPGGSTAGRMSSLLRLGRARRTVVRSARRGEGALALRSSLTSGSTGVSAGFDGRVAGALTRRYRGIAVALLIRVWSSEGPSRERAGGPRPWTRIRADERSVAVYSRLREVRPAARINRLLLYEIET